MNLPHHRTAEVFCIYYYSSVSEEILSVETEKGFHAFVQSLREYSHPLTLDNVNA